jgi:predicted DNA-binding mobile mystery protein A
VDLAVARQHLDQRLTPLRHAQGLVRPPRGWVRAIRDALGMTTAQLARRLGVDQSRVTRLEKAEVQDAVTLKSLRQAAEAMDCTLAYAFIPNPTLDEIVHRRADAVAQEEVGRVHHTMSLENQALTPSELERERRRTAEELLRANPRRLWDEPRAIH